MIRFRLDPNSAKQKYILSKALSMEMEGELMKDSRKDSKGRVLKDSESQRKDGSYEYKGSQSHLPLLAFSRKKHAMGYNSHHSSRRDVDNRN